MGMAGMEENMRESLSRRARYDSFVKRFVYSMTFAVVHPVI